MYLIDSNNGQMGDHLEIVYAKSIRFIFSIVMGTVILFGRRDE
jgi:hypothetical protein